MCDLRIVAIHINPLLLCANRISSDIIWAIVNKHYIFELTCKIRTCINCIRLVRNCKRPIAGIRVRCGVVTLGRISPDSFYGRVLIYEPSKTADYLIFCYTAIHQPKCQWNLFNRNVRKQMDFPNASQDVQPRFPLLYMTKFTRSNPRFCCCWHWDIFHG